MNFECPASIMNHDLLVPRPVQSGWTSADLGGVSTYFQKVHHSNFLSQRQVYQVDANSTGLLSFDGPMHIDYSGDVQFRDARSGDRSFDDCTLEFDSWYLFAPYDLIVVVMAPQLAACLAAHCTTSHPIDCHMARSRHRTCTTRL